MEMQVINKLGRHGIRGASGTATAVEPAAGQRNGRGPRTLDDPRPLC
ncbi:hypothetical protein ACFOET_08520 [Parapedobacter deserti]|uniref:Uncharacterized protein n=1 Tax=Parapedobacter deserti TaxID=1912957 RepID=A0ABV7JLG4_9SPHI